MTHFYALFLSILMFAGGTATAISPGQFKVPVNFSGIYLFENATELLPKVEYINGLRIVSPEPETMSFVKDEPVAVEFLRNGDAVIHVMLTQEEFGVMPETIVIRAEEFARSGLHFAAQGGAKELLENSRWAPSLKEARAGGGFNRAGRAHYRNAAGGSYYGCVASVCRAIGGCSGTVGNGVGMTSYLRRLGWRSVSCANPPVGAVASWSGGSHGLGHTGHWNGSGWCYDLGCGDPGAKYRMKDCVAR